MYQEIYDIFGDEDRHPDRRDLLDLPFLERCIKETLRKFSILPSVNRRATEDIHIGGTYAF